MSTLTSTIFFSPSLLIPARTKPTNSPNNQVFFHKNDHYLNRIVPQKKRASFCIKAQEQKVEEGVPSATIACPTVRPKFVLFGSSIVEYGFHEGWAATLAHLYGRQVDVVLRGYAGWNSRTALRILDKIFPKHATQQPSLVIVYFGGNDATHPQPDGHGSHVPLKEYSENMRKIFNHLKSLSEKTRIIFLSAPPVNEAQIFGNSILLGKPLRTNESCRIYSEAGLELCHELNIKAIDLWSALQKRDDWRDVCFLDGIHLSAEGNKIVAKEILKVLKEAEWEPSLHFKLMPVEFEEDSPYDPLYPDGKRTFNVSRMPFPETVEWD
ncbi:PREDICTED: GDSL esterase/lipase CPRD49-like isoform X1 [Lupinus angustifolius]|uniref:GDSL esterase/lipase CPRD49-like isoform X1 n=1 Tax=Lupinus angustifolius TaxID=3871 RepID=UPI00092E39EA|nr:PREDICTED: GDSL esterase/lipase CPRD49-like isoform X1 [Lupinus angustifolius]XP_019413288.1 PREDICTED: GDSL esterase/lipase CPRD49-like isoform X1 [Lupinus angustifolius]